MAQRLRNVLLTAAVVVLVGGGAMRPATADVIDTFTIRGPFNSPFAFIEEQNNPDHAGQINIGGTLTLNVTTGTLLSSGIVSDVPQSFGNIFKVQGDSSGTGIDLFLTSFANLNEIVLDLATASLVGYTGGEISGTGPGSDTVLLEGAYDIPFQSLGAVPLVLTSSVSTDPPPAAGAEPASLALQGGGLPPLGLVRGRRLA